ncbi:hypothetical protein NCC78_25160 [Micromonospora phytophila]|uniref:hypothetical protein n=1 Tax=Micromonospora phytophila TaxID=709888 RepID=UPI00202DD762|nr:hypothetical protein [Micromonospora phytophila]MCM0677940.1 hypothetical protein [Micromonospora phytophila]
MTGAWNRITRLTETVVGQARTARDRARELRAEFRTSDEPERRLVAPLVPDQEVRYVSLVGFKTHEFHRLGAQFADTMGDALAESLDPRVLFGLLNIVNPVVWVDAVMAPVRLAAGVLMLPGQAAAAAAGLPAAAAADAARAEPSPPEPARPGPPRPPVPLTPEQEAFRALFRLSRYRPLADQLAEIAYRRRYVFSGDLATLAGSLLLFMERYTGTPVAVTDTHLLLLRMGPRPLEDKPDHRRPRVLWSIDRRRIACIDCDYNVTRMLQFPTTVVFDDGSWIRLLNPAHREDQNRFVAALQGIPGKRPSVT